MIKNYCAVGSVTYMLNAMEWEVDPGSFITVPIESAYIGFLLGPSNQ